MNANERASTVLLLSRASEISLSFFSDSRKPNPISCICVHPCPSVVPVSIPFRVYSRPFAVKDFP
jgi:hypothetical protein